MGRVTRKKAAEVAEALHIDEDEVLELEEEAASKSGIELVVEKSERAPLGELEANSIDSKSQSDDGRQEFKKSARGKKGGKKSAKGKKNLAASTASPAYILDVSVNQPEVLPDENDSTPSPASEKAAEDLLKDFSRCKLTQVKIANSSLKSYDANAGVRSEHPCQGYKSGARPD